MPVSHSVWPGTAKLDPGRAPPGLTRAGALKILVSPGPFTVPVTVLFGVERTGPPGGGPARVKGSLRRVPGERGAYRSTGHRLTETGNRRP